MCSTGDCEVWLVRAEEMNRFKKSVIYLNIVSFCEYLEISGRVYVHYYEFSKQL